MSERNKGRPAMKYEVMDVRDLKYADNYFDIIIDKSTIDALLCGDNAFLNVARMVKEAQRTLKVGGAYIVISYGKPENREFHLESPFLKFDMKKYVLYPLDYSNEQEKEDSSHYIYICTKLEGADEVC